MATKTIILRPTSITCDNESLVTLYPSSVTMANAHTLVNEEVADDDATYITGGLGSNINYHFNISKPDDLKSITGFSFIVRHKMEASSILHSIAYKMYLGTDNFTLNTFTTNELTYLNMNDSVTNDVKDAIISLMNDTSDFNFYITQAVSTGTSKSKPIRTTQIYIEITYESNDAVVQYLKQNDTWVNIGELAIYYKQNYKWGAINDIQVSSLFADKYYLSEVIE